MFERATSLCIVSLWLAVAAGAQAHTTSASEAVAPGATTQIVNNVHPELYLVEDTRLEPPSALAPALQGFLAGALVGTGIGYLAVHEEPHEPWRGVLLGAGVGGLSGAGIGLGVGLLSGFQGRDAPARFVMRDMLYGSGLGGLFGSVIGGLVALDSDDAEDILVGAAIGGISGALLGTLVGVAEGQWRRRGVRVRAGLGAARDAGGQRVLVPGLSGSF